MRLSIDATALYQIELQGELDPSWAAELSGMDVRHSVGADGLPLTTLCGCLADQSALAGVLNLVFSLGLPILSVICLGNIAGPAQT
jgi:hypothetical protein